MVAEVKTDATLVAVKGNNYSNVVPINTQCVSCFQGQTKQSQAPVDGLTIEHDYVYMKDPETGKLVKVIVAGNKNDFASVAVQKNTELSATSPENKTTQAENKEPETKKWEDLTKFEKIMEATTSCAFLGGFLGTAIGAAVVVFLPPATGAAIGAMIGVGSGATLGAIGSAIFCDEKKEN